MKEYRYILEPYKGMRTRYNCPNCGKKKTFVRYIDRETNSHISPNVGKCNRLNNCGYHLSPKEYFKDNHQPYIPKIKCEKLTPFKETISFIPETFFFKSLKLYEQNNFIKFLLSKFGDEITDHLIKRYFIGTSKHWEGATIFWQRDLNNKLRTGKIMLYNAQNGKRIKEPFNHITWAHSILRIQNIKQCFFGEHLLKNELTKPIAIVESEKTAIIASVYFPKFIWLACGGANNLTIGRCKVLKGRKIILFPDLNLYDVWSKKADQLSNIACFKVSDLLEKTANETERKDGLDIADYILLRNRELKNTFVF